MAFGEGLTALRLRMGLPDALRLCLALNLISIKHRFLLDQQITSATLTQFGIAAQGKEASRANCPNFLLSVAFLPRPPRGTCGTAS